MEVIEDQDNSILTVSGDIVQLVGMKHKSHIIQLERDAILQTHRGQLDHNDLIGIQWGSTVKSHINRTFYLLKPTIADLINELPRNTQILYPKDIGYILLTMGIGPGSHVGEAGSGSGGLTTALAFTIGNTGRVFSFESNEEAHNLAVKNLQRFGLEERVRFKLADIGTGIDANNLDAFFLDVQTPFKYLKQVKACLKPGGHFGCIAPTMNQVQKTLESLEESNFAFVEVCEILLRYFRSNPDRLRPVDRMVAHTGFLIFARSMLPLNARGTG